MAMESMLEARQRLGVDRVLEPINALPQAALRLDPSGPVRPYEVELAVERLSIDSTSYRNLRLRGNDDPDAIAALVLEIVAARGKMHNPETDSGGVLLGTVTAVGDHYLDPPDIGKRVVPMCSLTVGALRLEKVTAVDPTSVLVDVSGTAYYRAPCAALPEDIPEATAIGLLEVSTAAAQLRDLLPPTGTVYVLGAGHGGKLALAAARQELDTGQLVAIDVDSAAVEQTVALGLCDVAVTADLADPIETLKAVQAAGLPPADLTVVVVNATRCESTAILLTAEGGTVLFFSIATNFAAAALAGDGIGSEVRLLIGSSYAHGRGAYALEVYRRSPALQEALASPAGVHP